MSLEEFSLLAPSLEPHDPLVVARWMKSIGSAVLPEVLAKQGPMLVRHAVETVSCILVYNADLGAYFTSIVGFRADGKGAHVAFASENEQANAVIRDLVAKGQDVGRWSGDITWEPVLHAAYHFVVGADAGGQPAYRAVRDTEMPSTEYLQ